MAAVAVGVSGKSEMKKPKTRLVRRDVEYRVPPFLPQPVPFFCSQLFFSCPPLLLRLDTLSIQQQLLPR